MKSEKETPVLVGVGRLTRKQKLSEGDPIAYMAECAALAITDAGCTNVLTEIDSLGYIAVMSGNDEDGPRRLAAKLGAAPEDLVTTVFGAVLPLSLTTRLCRRIAKGESNIGLICGAEAFYSNEKPDWDRLTSVTYSETDIPVIGESRDPSTELEKMYGLHVPAVVYPLFANAYRAHQQLSLADFQEKLGTLCSIYSTVASGNRFAWSKEARSATELAMPSAGNRMVHYPFTKFMNANMNVDQSAALLIMSESKADELGIATDKRVYLAGSNEAYETWFVSERANFHTAPALAVATDQALKQAGIDRSKVSHADIYSCFPIAAQIGIDTMKLEPDLCPTITGGLPYYGGAGTHYSLHALCEMVEVLRADPGSYGLVQSLSWFMSKFAMSILTTTRSALPASESLPAGADSPETDSPETDDPETADPETYSHRTRKAVLDGDEWVVNAVKNSISWADADYFTITCRTEDPARGIWSLSNFFIPRDTEGVQAPRLWEDLGSRGAARGEVRFEDVRIPKDYLVGERGRAYVQMAQLFDTNRAYIGLKCIGAAQASVDETCEYAKQRIVMGKPISNFQGVSFPLVEAETQLEAARLLCYKTLWLRDNDQSNAKEGAMCKWWVPEITFEIVRQCLTLHGHYGYSNELPFAY